MLRPLLTISLAALWAGAAAGQSKDDVDKAQKVVADHLAAIKGTAGQVLHLNEPDLAKAFPSDIFFAVRYRIYPVARVLPEGMKRQAPSLSPPPL